MTAPPIRILLAVFLGEDRFKGATMQVPLDYIASREDVGWQVCEEQFVDHSFSCDTHRAFLFARLGCVATTTRESVPRDPTAIAGQSERLRSI